MPTESASNIPLTSKQELRLELNKHIKAFLKAGGSIKKYDRHESAYADHTREFMQKNSDKIKSHIEKEFPNELSNSP